MGPLTLLLALPLLGFVCNGLAGSRLPRRAVAVIACGLPVLAFVLAIALFRQVAADGMPVAETLYPWVAIPGFDVGVDLYFDQVTAVMCLVVTGIGSLIHIYSVGYMAHDRGFARYFAYLNLFLFFMLVLVLGRNLVVMFVGWEGVGLASYLLIGFWFDDDAKTAAGLKAFIVNRVGDTGFVLAAFLLYLTVGSLDFQVVNAYFTAHPPPSATTTAIALLLLLGVCGKSAQIPLHVWLPDAMAGPTPVSALIHAATMVTAGVYLLARMNGVYVQAPAAMQVVAWVGATTALLGATMGVTQFTLKKVLAYSTISQLGLMVMACGLGAFTAGMFHLVTHAFFKACLFLGAGAVLHALHGEEDMRRMGGLAAKMPFSFATFLVATLALCGIPPLAGFFSKDEILWQAWLDADGIPWLWLFGLTTSALTGYYMVRAIFLTFLGPAQGGNAPASAPHDPPLSMSAVLGVLALGSAVAGFVGLPGVLQELVGVDAPFHDFLAPILHPVEAKAGTHAIELVLMAAAVLVAIAGMLAARIRYGSRRGRAASDAPGAVRSLVEQGYYFDRFYDRVIVRSIDWVSASLLARRIEVGIERLSLAAPAATARFTSMLFTRLQTGNVQAYAFYALAGLALALAWVAARG